MEVKYNITERLQKELVASGKEAGKTQTAVVLDTEVSEIITSSEFVTVTDSGRATMDLTGKVLLHTSYKLIYAEEGPASNWVWRKEFTVGESKFFPHVETDEMFWCDHKINSGATIKQALKEIEAINEEKTRKAGERTAEELATFPERIDAYNRKEENRQYVEALKKIEALERQNNYLQQKNEALKEELRIERDD